MASRLHCSFFLVVGGLFSTGAALPTDTEGASEASVVPVYGEPNHHLVYQNALARVLDIRVPPGHLSKYHVHANPLVAVTVEDARNWSQQPGRGRGPVSPRGAVPFVGDNWDDPLPYTHRVANVDVVPYHRIAAEWLAPAPGACAALRRVRGYRLVRKGKFGRVYAIRLRPGQSTPRHTHSCPGLTVQGSAGSLRNEGRPPDAAGGSGAGHWFWRSAGYAHSLRNAGKKSVTLFEIDWR